MKLKGIHITSLGMFRKYFKLEKIWENIDNGRLLDFEREQSRQKVYAAEQITELLEAYENQNELPEMISKFYSCDEWKAEKLEEALEALLPKSKDHDGNHFYSRNVRGIQKIISSEDLFWNEERASMFYLFLLLEIQANPKEEISEKEFLFVKEYLKAMLPRAEKAEKNSQIPRLYPYSSGVLYLRGGMIVNDKNNLLSPENEKISCYAYSDDLGLLAFTKQGTISACTEPDIKYEIEQRLKEREEKHVRMAAAYGSIYILLMEDGTILGNIEDSIGKWENIEWIGAGLNSITAIYGNNRCLQELGSDSKLRELSGVKAVYTRSDDTGSRYIVLKDDDSLIMDDNVQEAYADAANIDRNGYLYAEENKLYFRKFGDKRKVVYKLETGYRSVELCKDHSNIYCRAVFSEEEKLFTIKEENMVLEN